MARYDRRGHWRRGKNGSLHWVSAHHVRRDDFSRGYGARRAGGYEKYRRPQTSGTRAEVIWHRIPDHPNAECPVCGDDVWFIRARNGGCAYFDALGKPWPLHPCMALDRSKQDRLAAAAAAASYPGGPIRQSHSAATSAPQPEANPRADTTGSPAPAPTAAPASASAQTAAQKPPEPMTYETVLQALWALLLSIPVSYWVMNRLDAVPDLLWLWLIVLPTVVLGIAIVTFLARTRPSSRTEVEEGSWAARMIVGLFLVGPVFLIVGIIGNVLSLGFGALLLAATIASESRRQPGAASG